MPAKKQPRTLQELSLDRVGSGFFKSAVSVFMDRISDLYEQSLTPRLVMLT